MDVHGAAFLSLDTLFVHSFNTGISFSQTICTASELFDWVITYEEALMDSRMCQQGWILLVLIACTIQPFA